MKYIIFNTQHAIIGFINTGLLSFFINYTFGSLSDAIISGFIQGTITFMIVGFNTALFENLYDNTKSYIISVLIPSITTSSISYLVHSISSSPSPVWTAFGIFLFAFINFSVLFLLKKKIRTIKPTDIIKSFKK